MKTNLIEKLLDIVYQGLKKYGVEILTALGISFLTYKGIDIAFDTLLQQLQSSIMRVDSAALQLFFISGGGEALNIIISAYSAKIAFNSVSQVRFKPQS